MPDSLQAAYAVIGVPPDADAAALRTAYRHLVQLHHPDHNGGSRAAARRFAEVQAAYATILEARREAATSATPAREGGIEDRLAAMERELRMVRAAETARRAQAARRSPPPPRPTPEELGYVTTDDSVSDIFNDLVRKLRRTTGL